MRGHRAKIRDRCVKPQKKRKCRERERGKNKGEGGEGKENKRVDIARDIVHRPNPVAEYSTFVLGGWRGKGRRGGKMRGETSVGRDPIKWRLINSRAQNACETCASIGSVIIKTLPTTTPTDITLIIPFGLARFLSGYGWKRWLRGSCARFRG